MEHVPLIEGIFLSLLNLINTKIWLHTMKALNLKTSVKTKMGINEHQSNSRLVQIQYFKRIQFDCSVNQFLDALYLTEVVGIFCENMLLGPYHMNKNITMTIFMYLSKFSTY